MTTIKSKLLDQSHAFGPMLMEFFSPGMPAIIAATGADFALFDMEHTGASLETMKAMVAGCRGLRLAPLVRVPRGEYHFIARALDIGAHGIMVPMVGSAAEAAAIASAAHYPPAGRRGAGFGIAHDDYRVAPPPETMARAAARTLTIAQIETVEGLDDVEAIVATPGIDVAWLGHFDLSNFMGIPGQCIRISSPPPAASPMPPARRARSPGSWPWTTPGARNTGTTAIACWHTDWTTCCSRPP
jgi:2-keto-3-deoxy-L-rhamnonate aldolase RhmA